LKKLFFTFDCSFLPTMDHLINIGIVSILTLNVGGTIIGTTVCTDEANLDGIGRLLWHSEDGKLNLFSDQPNPRPVVGVLAQEITSSKFFGTKELELDVKNDSIGWVDTAYIKWLESSGALVMPIPLSTNRDDLLDLMQNHLSGLVLPGSNAGPVNKPLFLGLLSAVMEFTITRQTNIPIFGICMGHQIIYQTLAAAKDSIYTGADHYSRLVDVNNTRKMNLNMKIVEPRAKIITGITNTMVQTLAKDRVVLHNHAWGITREMLQNVEGLITVAVAENSEGFEFVSIMEHEDLPLFGTQWHPEKPSFTFGRKNGGSFNFIHSRRSIEVSQFFGNNFVDVCRKHSNRFMKKDKLLSYSMIPVLVESAQKTAVYLI